MNEPDSTQEFFWIGTDGSTVLAHWMKHGYGLFGYRVNNLAKAIDALEPTTDLAFIPFGADFYVPDEKLIQQFIKLRVLNSLYPQNSSGNWKNTRTSYR